MALVISNGGTGWGALTTTVGAGDAQLPTCLARLVQNKNGVLVDALPYLDKEYDKPAMRDLVDSMIDDEMEEFDPEDYISSLPPVPKPSFPEGSILAKEYARIDADPASRFNAIDTSRYQALPPSGKEAGKLEAWEEAVKRAQTLQEHAGLRLMNDELMQQYSVNAWRAFNSGLEDRNALFKQEAELEKVRVLQVNRKRMAAQKQVENKIQKLQDQYQQQVAKNMRIEAECLMIERSLAPQ